MERYEFPALEAECPPLEFHGRSDWRREEGSVIGGVVGGILGGIYGGPVGALVGAAAGAGAGHVVIGGQGVR